MNADVIIVGAGACGLMSALELSKAGKKILVLEAKDRIGGRIYPLPEADFGYPAQGGAEFIHGDAPITRALMKEAQLGFMETDGETWSSRGGNLTKATGGPTNEPIFLEHKEELQDRLKKLNEDLPIKNFLDKYFNEEKYTEFRNQILKIVEGYDAADPEKISTFMLREEWLGTGEWKQGRIKEGYGALLNFLEDQCKKNGVQIKLGEQVKSIHEKGELIVAESVSGVVYESYKILVTVSLPTIESIKFTPEFPKKTEAVSKIGFGLIIKLVLKFKSRWWIDSLGQDLSKMSFMLTDEVVGAWWTQYPDESAVLVGWIPGLPAKELSTSSSEEILEIALKCLGNTFKVSKDIIKKELVSSEICNWPADEHVRGAYSYTTPETDNARKILVQPIDGKIFFAGEALYSGKETATVEGALGSGKEAAEKILNI